LSCRFVNGSKEGTEGQRRGNARERTSKKARNHGQAMLEIDIDSSSDEENVEISGFKGGRGRNLHQKSKRECGEWSRRKKNKGRDDMYLSEPQY